MHLHCFVDMPFTTIVLNNFQELLYQIFVICEIAAVAGKFHILIDTKIGKIGICYDFEFPEVPRILAMKGAEIILRLAAEGSPCDEQHNVHPRSRALENGVFVVDSNRVGDEGGFHFFGRSQIVAPDGSVLARTDDQEENIVFASLDKGLIQNRIPTYSIEDQRSTLSY